MGERVIAGKYRLVRPLGAGGMGSVWLGEHVSLKTPVAVKLIHPDLLGVPSARKRFDREARAVAKLRSAHVVQVLDHGTDEGEPYLVMECLTGQDIRARLQERGRLSPVETARIVSHVARALTKAHEAGVVHRDLKPDNLFACPGEDGEVVKVLDFGVAKAADLLASGGGLDPTRTGELLGTPCYMSPEQAQGLRGLDFRSDLWSLGVVVFECLTSARPFDAPSLGPLIAQIVAGRIPVPSAFASDLPPAIDAWMAKALSRAPEQRFASAREMSEAFAVAAGAADVGWGKPSIAPPPRPPPADEDDQIRTVPLARRPGTILQPGASEVAPKAAPPSGDDLPTIGLVRRAPSLPRWVLVGLAVVIVLVSANILLALHASR